MLICIYIYIYVSYTTYIALKCISAAAVRAFAAFFSKRFLGPKPDTQQVLSAQHVRRRLIPEKKVLEEIDVATEAISNTHFL